MSRKRLPWHGLPARAFSLSLMLTTAAFPWHGFPTRGQTSRSTVAGLGVKKPTWLAETVPGRNRNCSRNESWFSHTNAVPSLSSPSSTGWKLVPRKARRILLSTAPDSRIVYRNNFEQAQLRKVPDDIMVLDGTFTVRQIDGNKCLELAGDPIGSFAALFGPDGLTGADVSARIQAFPQGKRFPEFGIGAGGPGGYKLFAVPGQNQLELRKGEEVKAAAPFDWSPGSWTCFRLRVEPGEKNDCTIQAKAWKQGATEPDAWMLSAKDAKPPSGKASIWGSDYSEQPIRFDDLSVATVAQK